MDFRKMYTHDRFANEMGIELEELSAKSAKMGITIADQHLNAGNVAHGGVIFTLADITMAAMANTQQFPSVSIQSDMRFLAAAYPGDRLTATAEPVFARKSMSNCRVSVKNQDGELIAIAEGMFHTKQKLQVEQGD